MFKFKIEKWRNMERISVSFPCTSMLFTLSLIFLFILILLGKVDTASFLESLKLINKNS